MGKEKVAWDVSTEEGAPLPSHFSTCPCTQLEGRGPLLPAGLGQGSGDRGRTLGWSPWVLGSSPSEFLAEPRLQVVGNGPRVARGSQLCNQAGAHHSQPQARGKQGGAEASGARAWLQVLPGQGAGTSI